MSTIECKLPEGDRWRLRADEAFMRKQAPLPPGGPGALALDLMEQMFDYLPDSPFFIKDKALTYVSVNMAMVRFCGARTRAEVIGRTAADFFPNQGRVWSESLDQQVLRSGKPIKDQLHLAERLHGTPVWLLIGRWPVFDEGESVVGVAQNARLLPAPDRKHVRYERLAAALERITQNLSARIEVAALARRVGVSVSQLERDFVELFGISPTKYISKVKLEAALEMVRAGYAIADVAHACGYSDQSAFTRRFQAAIGMSPTEYRRRHSGR